MSTSIPRRSGRERTSTVIEIDGYSVRKDNNYVVKGHAYQFGETKPTLQKTEKLNVSAAALHRRSTATTVKRKPRAINPLEVARRQHKAEIQQRIAERASARLGYLASHLHILSPFLDAATIAKLQEYTLDASQAQEKEQLCNSTLDFSNDVVQPELVQAKLRDYQLVGLNWMVRMDRLNLGMILGDEMGLGKTLQTIAFLSHLKEKGRKGPSLVLCPLSVLYSWCTEFTKWAPSLKILRFHSSCPVERSAQRDLLVHDILSYDVVVTTYEMAKQPQLSTMLWNRFYFQYLVLDEGHKIKDASNQISQAVRAMHCENKLILTGTPLQNNLVELWSLLNFLYPDIFLSSEPFRAAFDMITNSVQKERLSEAQHVLKLFMLRRLKVQVERLLPPKIETKVLCPLSTTQIYWYKALLLKDISLLVKATANSGAQGSSAGKAKVLNNLIMQLRKCCLHPYLFTGAEPPDVSMQEYVGASGKLSVLDMLLRSLFKKGHRTVLFSQFTSVLDVLEDYCNMRGWSYVRFDGSTARATRNHLVTLFQNDESVFLFLMSTRSGGMGLNLQAADTCILFDSDWNPQPDLQAMARVHRIGQTKTVHVYRLISSGTIEERMVERAEKKLYMDQMVNSTALTSGNSGTIGNPNQMEVTENDMLSTLQFGCNAVFGDDANTRNILPTEEDIEIITDRTRTAEHSAGLLKGGMASKTENFEPEKEFISSTALKGVDFKVIRDKLEKKHRRSAGLGGTPNSLGGIADEWRIIQNQKRQSKSRLIMVNGLASGYGKALVPVLAANNYDLEKGESSVFSRELNSTDRSEYGVQRKKVKKIGVDFDTQDFCQVCGDGGTLLCCPRCPVAVHSKCAGVKPSDFLSCSHHRCVVCQKNTEAAGGLLFPCQSCPSAYCEDCRPMDAQVLGNCPRFEELGFSSTRAVYIHCSQSCENVAKVDFGWKPVASKRDLCPPPLDTSEYFGTTASEDTCPGEFACPSETLTASRCGHTTATEVTHQSNNRVASFARKVTESFDMGSPTLGRRQCESNGKKDSMVKNAVVIDVDSSQPSRKKRRGLDGKENVGVNCPSVIDLVSSPESTKSDCEVGGTKASTLCKPTENDLNSRLPPEEKESKIFSLINFFFR